MLTTTKDRPPATLNPDMPRAGRTHPGGPPRLDRSTALGSSRVGQGEKSRGHDPPSFLTASHGPFRLMPDAPPQAAPHATPRPHQDQPAPRAENLQDAYCA